MLLSKQDQVDARGDDLRGGAGGGGGDARRPPQRAAGGRQQRVSRRTVARGRGAAEPELDPGPLSSRQGALRRRQYSVSTLSVLTRRYVKVRGDLLVSIGDGTELNSVERRYAQRCSEYLREAKSQLESRQANFFVCSNLLFLADVTLVWLYPYGNLGLRCDAVKARLRGAGPEAQWLIDALDAARAREDDRFLRSALEDALNHLQQFEQDDAIADDLQVTRLRMLLLYMTAALVVLFLVVPYAVIDLRASHLRGWPVVIFESSLLTQWVSAAAVCAVGAVGGILSGLLATRDSTTTLLDYRASLLRLALKPLVGAVAALTLYFFLTWQILTGVQVTSGGTFLLAGFLAGFSERYFLRILKAEEGSPVARDGRRESPAAAGQPAPSAPFSSKLLDDRAYDDDDHSPPCRGHATPIRRPSSTAGTG